MKQYLSLLLALAFALAPSAVYADEIATSTAISGEAKPIQILKNGYIMPSLQEPATVDWSTGRGRKDGVLEWAVDDNYLKKTSGMFLRGFSNAGFGWAEVITHPVRWSKNAPLGLGTTAGLIVGPVMAVLRTASGVIDIATCWVPLWHGVPMSKPALGLHDVHNYGTIDDVEAYDHQVKRYFFNKLSDEY